MTYEVMLEISKVQMIEQVPSTVGPGELDGE